MPRSTLVTRSQRRRSRRERRRRSRSKDPTPDMRPTVLVVDDQTVLADAVTRFLARTWRALPFVTALNEVEAALQREHVDVVLLDVMFPGGETSLPRLRDWCARYPTTHFIIHTGFPDKAPVARVLADGALGYIRKDEGEGLPEIGRAVRTVLVGGIYLPSAHGTEDGVDHDAPADPFDRAVRTVVARLRFTRALAEVSVLRFEGMLMKQIAARLQISEAAAEDRLRRIAREHGVSGIAALVRVIGAALRATG